MTKKRIHDTLKFPEGFRGRGETAHIERGDQMYTVWDLSETTDYGSYDTITEALRNVPDGEPCVIYRHMTRLGVFHGTGEEVEA